MSLFLAKKQENVNQKKVRDLSRSKENKKCFDCQAKNPIFANTTIQTFVCARCSDLVREYGHRVKAISTSKFSGAELLALKKGGNAMGRKIWENGYTPLETTEPATDEDIRAFMRKKYFEQKWLDRALLQSHKEEVRALIAKSFTEDGLPIVTKKSNTKKMLPGFSRLPLIADNEMNIMHDDEDEEEEEVYKAPSPLNRPTSQSMSHPLDTAPQQLEAYETMDRTSVDSQRSGTSTSSSGSIYSNTSQSDMRYSGNNTNSWKYMSSNPLSMGYTNNTIPVVSQKQHLKLTEPYVPNEQIFMEQAQEHSYQPNPYYTSVPINNEHIAPTYHSARDLQQSSLLIDANTVAESTIPANTSATKTVTPKIAEPSSHVPPSASASVFDSILSDLSGLKLEKTVRRATYTGGILAPSSVVVPVKSTSQELTKERPATMFDTDFFAKFNQTISSNNNESSDQYAALRGIQTVIQTKEEDKHHTSSSEDEDDEDPWQDFCSSSSFQNETSSFLQNEVKNVKQNEPLVSIDLFGDLDPRSMLRKLS